MTDALPTDVTNGASVRGNEWGWSVSSFPTALRNAEARGYACLGGQFQFRVPNGGTCEMYWLSADSTERHEGELWADYSHRSCSEVLDRFHKRLSETNFTKEAADWPIPINPEKDLVFVAYFVTAASLAEITAVKNSV